MPSPIDLIRSAVPSGPIRPPALAGERPESGEFRNILRDAIRDVENHRAGAEESTRRLLAGEEEELHQVALATQRAELAFELFLQARNKVVQAYQEIMRMQV